MNYIVRQRRSCSMTYRHGTLVGIVGVTSERVSGKSRTMHTPRARSEIEIVRMHPSGRRQRRADTRALSPSWHHTNLVFRLACRTRLFAPAKRCGGGRHLERDKHSAAHNKQSHNPPARVLQRVNSSAPKWRNVYIASTHTHSLTHVRAKGMCVCLLWHFIASNWPCSTAAAALFVSVRTCAEHLYTIIPDAVNRITECITALLKLNDFT